MSEPRHEPDQQSIDPAPLAAAPDSAAAKCGLNHTEQNEPRAADPAVDRSRLRWEVLIVLGLSLGQSAVYSIISLTAKLTAGPPLGSQTTTVNRSLSPRPYLDLTYQLANVVFTLVPVLLALWLLAGTLGSMRAALRDIGLDWSKPRLDFMWGCLLAAGIGLPGLALYALGRHLGITTEVVAADLNTYWWTIPVLVLQAVKNSLLEEVIVVAYLLRRLPLLGWGPWHALLASAILRGSYHLYQGIGPFFGNVVMGLVFGWFFQRTSRVLPLVIAHALLDIVAFVGYQAFLR